MSSKGAKSSSVDLSYLNDKKLEKGKKKFKEETETTWKGPSHKERREEATNAKQAMKRRAASKDDRVSWKKKAGGIAAILFMCGVGLMQFLSAIFGAIAGDGITALDVQDTAKLKEVLFGGEPWLIYCVNNETQGQRLPKVLEESARSLRSSIGLNVGVLSCWEPTSSGRSVAQRFKLRTSPPLTFLIANGNKPRIMNLVGVKEAEDIERKAKPALTLEPQRIDSLKSWPAHCTSRRNCLVIGYKHQSQRDNALSVIRPLMESHRTTRVVTLDTSFWSLKLDDEVLKRRPRQVKGSYRADVLCLSRDEGGSKSNGTHSGNFLGELDSGSASSFLTACEQREDLVKIGVPPRIKAKPSKPKKVKVPPPPPPPRPAPSPPPRSTRDTGRANVDSVGSRAKMEAAAAEEALFEAVEEDDEAADGEAGDDSQGEAGDDNEDGSEDEDASDEEVEL